MKKDAYYFSHDSNAKDDPKCMLLIEELQLEGYGIYWVLVEILREQPEFKYPLKMIPVLARKFLTTKEKMLTVINNYGLFVIEDGEFFYSESLNRRMGLMNDKREKARLAGKKSGEARRLKALEHKEQLNVSSTNDEQTMNVSSTNDEQLNEIKENEIKEENKVEEIELLSEEQIKDLNDSFPDIDYKFYIEKIKSYGKSKNKVYEDYYFTIMTWARKDIMTRGGYDKIIKKQEKISLADLEPDYSAY